MSAADRGVVDAIILALNTLGEEKMISYDKEIEWLIKLKDIMKELSIEEKAKAYDNVREKIAIRFGSNVAEEIFSEFEESKDERIRKSIIKFLIDVNNGAYTKSEIEIASWIAWLEKQDESTEINPSEFDLRLNKLLKQFESLPKEELISSLSFYLNVVQNDGTYKEEKQGEQKETLCDKCKKAQPSHSCQDITALGRCYIENINTSIDKIKPKFKVGDWIVWKDKCYKVNYNGCGYELVDQDGLSTSLEYGTIDENAHIWDITKDAKDGDVLADKYNNIGIFQECEGICWHSYIYLGCDGELRGFNNIGGSHEQTDAHPATQEQRDLLFQKMKEVEYEWDAEKKDAKKIEQKPTDEEIKTLHRTEYEKGRADAIADMQKLVDCIDCTNSKGCINCEDGNMKETLVQNPAWSEDDESNLNTTIAYLKDAKEFKKSAENCINWLKSLKDRVQPILRRRHTIFDEII